MIQNKSFILHFVILVWWWHWCHLILTITSHNALHFPFIILWIYTCVVKHVSIFSLQIPIHKTMNYTFIVKHVAVTHSWVEKKYKIQHFLNLGYFLAIIFPCRISLIVLPLIDANFVGMEAKIKISICGQRYSFIKKIYHIHITYIKRSWYFRHG